MKCDTCRELLTAYLKAELEEAQTAEVEEHLATCAACTQHCEHLRSAVVTVDPQDEAPMIRIVNVILERAHKDRATDIEIHPMGNEVQVYYRIAGTMHEVMRLPEYVHKPLVNRLRVMADILLADRRQPQEGRIQVQVLGEPMDLAMKITPQANGDFVSLHIRGEAQAEYRRPPITCETCREMLTAYLKAELDDALAAQVEEHLATCAECAKEVEGARKVLAQLDAASEEPILKIVSVIVEKAVRERASDIHIRMIGDHCSVFYRIDGVMHEAMRLPDHVHVPLGDRIKLMADIPLTVRNAPQDGRIRTEVESKALDLRVSVVPAVTGASLVIRIFDSTCAHLTLDDVHLVGEQRDELNKLLNANLGMVCVTGPTGSGKTTTLYAMLQELNQPDHHCMTIEDPVEYLIEGVTQMHVNPRVGMGFKDAMKAAMRQDPDIIMCGEIRDRDTLELCMQAAMWGHLVLTTVHTLDSVSVIRRLLDVGAHRFMVAQSFIGATAQRLLRRVCPDCKEEYVATDVERAWLEALGLPAPARLWRGKGCEACRQTGCRGRTAAYEILIVDEKITEMLLRNATIDDIESHAASLVKPMRVAAAERVLAGDVSAAETMRVMAYQPEY